MTIPENQTSFTLRASPQWHPKPDEVGTKTSKVLFIGDANCAEFQGPVEHMRRSSVLEIEASMDAALSRSPEPWPDLVVLGQSRAGELPSAAMPGLRRKFPLAAIVLLVGGWSEGQTRSVAGFEGVLRIHWHQWTAFWQQQLDRLDRKQAPNWSLPATFTDAERATCVTFGAMKRPLSILIRSPNPEIAALLQRLLERSGGTVHKAVDGQVALTAGPDVAVWDASGGDESTCAALRRFVDLVHPAPVVALAGFPRWGDRQNLFAAGASAVMAKPFLIAELLEALTRCSRQTDTIAV